MQSLLREQFTAVVAKPWRLIPGLGCSQIRPVQLNPVSFTVRRGGDWAFLVKMAPAYPAQNLARTAPTTGVAELRGSVASILEVGTGFHPDLTGQENVYLNGAILGCGARKWQRQWILLSHLLK